MKKTLLIFTIFLVSSCSIMKNKSKEKLMSSSVENTSITASTDLKIREREDIATKDSLVTKQDFKIEKSTIATSQKINLINNGRCADPGILRFVQITDLQGNKTEIPVNDNTDLQFGNDSKFDTEISDLKIENSALLRQNKSYEKDTDSLQSLNTNLNKELITKSMQLDLKTKSSPLSAFIWVVLLSIAAWEILKFYLKKQTIL